MPRWFLPLLFPALVNAQDLRPIHAIPHLPSVHIDGAAEDWGDAGLRVSAFAEDAERPVPAPLYAAAVRLGWNERGLAVLVELTSDAPWTEVTSMRSPWEADSVELFLRTGSAWSNLVQCVITPGLADNAPEPRSVVLDYRGNDPRYAGLPTAAEVARVRTPRGGRIEALLPWSQLAATPTPGAEFEFSVKLNKILTGTGRRQLAWNAPDGTSFQRLVLADAPSAAVDQAAWLLDLGNGELAANAVAPAAFAGRTATVRADGSAVATVAFRAEGGRAVAALTTATPAVGTRVTLTVDDATWTATTAPDTAAVLRTTLERAVHATWRAPGPRELALRPRLPATLEAGPLPQATLPDLILATRAGITGLTTQWYNEAFEPVARADAPGRYGAVVTIRLAAGDTERLYHTARLGDDAVNAAASDARWWHTLRSRLGIQVRYPYAKRLPAGYDEDPARRWPAIIYLHGSGGAVPSDYAPMEQRLAAAPERDLLGWLRGNPRPVAVYALQSVGAWNPYAVEDAVRAILAEDRIDPDRVIVMGFSMGGMGTWNCALDVNHLWAAAVPIGGRGSRAGDVALLGDLPVWIFNGDADATTTLEDAQVIHEAALAAGRNVRMTVLPGADHGASQNGTFSTPGLWEWLLERRRPN